MKEHVFTGFGFGPIQGGLFIKEAFESGNFRRLAAAEVDSKLVKAVRENDGTYYVNVAGKDGIETIEITGVEMLNPQVKEDRAQLIEAVAESTEIVTSLPSVDFYNADDTSPAVLIAEGLSRKKASGAIIYAAENNNRAAEILERSIAVKCGEATKEPVQFLNTVIGKMSGVITGNEISELGLQPIAPGIDRAFLVEEFNRILVTRTKLGGFEPGIKVFIEKDDLLPFEEAKLYGHNAIHATLAYLGALKGYEKMTELAGDAGVMGIGKAAFLDESGAALIRKYASLGDELFTESGYRHYAEDLLERMTNRYLTDTIARAGRDPVRKLGYSDRIFGTMALALEEKIVPENMAVGAMAGVVFLLEEGQECGLPEEMRKKNYRELNDSDIEAILKWIWKKNVGEYAGQIIECVQKAKQRLEKIV